MHKYLRILIAHALPIDLDHLSTGTRKNTDGKFNHFTFRNLPATAVTIIGLNKH